MAHVCQCLGWTWDYCDWHLDIPRLISLNRYWRNSPPVHLLVAAYMGIKPRESEVPPATPDQMAELSEMFETRPMPKITTPEEYLARKQSYANQ